MKKILLTLFLVINVAVIGYGQNFWSLVNNQINSFAFGMASNGDVYALTNSTFLYKSTTNGTIGSWNQVTGFPATNAYSIFAKGNTVFMLNGNGVDFNGRGIYATTDGGATWTPRNNGLAADTNMTEMYQMANGVLLVGVKIDPFTTKTYYSSNDGMSWTFGQTLNGDIRSIALVSPSEAYMAVDDEVFKSTNNGQTWVDLNASFPAPPVKIVANSSGDLLGAENFDILQSTDGGVTWTTKTTSGLPSLAGNLITTFRILHGETIYIALDNNEGVYYSEDWGDTWTEITSNINNSQIFDKSMAVSATGYLFASPSNSGIYRSVNPVTASTVGIEEMNMIANKVTIFPNPTENKIYFQVAEDFSGSVEVLNQVGEVVFSNYYDSMNLLYSEGIDIENYASGIYFVKIKAAEGDFVQKIIKR